MKHGKCAFMLLRQTFNLLLPSNPLPEKEIPAPVIFQAISGSDLSESCFYGGIIINDQALSDSQ